MISRLINWITNPFKKEEKITLPNVEPLSDEVKNKLISDLIEVAKEFKEKKETELDTSPLIRVSDETKEKIATLVKEDLKSKIPLNVEHEVIITESAPKKKKRYYKKKKATDSSK